MYNKFINFVSIFGKIILLIILFNFSFTVLNPNSTNPNPFVFLDYANLLFHEGGHLVFFFFGHFLYVLGGSLMQLLIPIVVFIAFLRQRDWYACSFSSFWLGESMINLSHYIGDARARVLPLLGGDTSAHDWYYLLNNLNLLNYDTLIAKIVFIIGAIIIVFSLIWMAINIFASILCLFNKSFA